MSSGSSSDQGGYGPHMKTVGWAILVMCISLAIVIVLWLWFGRIGPTFFCERLSEQREELRRQYDMPPTTTRVQGTAGNATIIKKHYACKGIASE